jgi:hypothetical protein
MPLGTVRPSGLLVERVAVQRGLQMEHQALFASLAEAELHLDEIERCLGNFREIVEPAVNDRSTSGQMEAGADEARGFDLASSRVHRDVRLRRRLADIELRHV